MKTEYIKELAEIIDEFRLGGLEYGEGDWYIKLYAQNKCSKIDDNFVYQNLSKETKYSVPNEKNIDKYEIHENIETVKSTMIGTFHCRASSSDDVFVKEGDVVKKGQVICMIESMKLMNEIKALYDCKIIEILVDENDIVEYGQELYRVEKL